MNPHYHRYDSSESTWENMRDNPWYIRGETDWEEVNSPSYIYNGSEWTPMEGFSDPWGENTLSSTGSTYALMAGNLGAMPEVRSLGNMSFTDTNKLFPTQRPLQLSTGSGYLRWKVPSSQKCYFRIYLRSEVGTNDYNRRVISLHKGSISVIDFVCWSRGTSSPSGRNHIGVAINDVSATDTEGAFISTPVDSLPSGQWCRVEGMVDRAGIIAIKIYTDPHSTKPSYYGMWDNISVPIPEFDSLRVSEYAFTNPANRQTQRVQNLAMGSSGWIGPVDGPGVYLAEYYNGLISSNSASAQIPNLSISAGHYVLLSLVYTDTHTTTSVPNITPPAGFTRLGFEYVGATGSDHRAILVMYGKYFSSADSTNKQFSVGGGRAGRWIMNQRQYVNVHPDHPIAATWEGTSNSPGGGVNPRRIFPDQITGVQDGDIGVAAALLKSDAPEADAWSGWFSSSFTSPTTRNYPGGVGHQNHSNGRRHAILHDDIYLSGPSHPAPAFLAEKTTNTTDAWGRIALRKNRVLDYTPAPITDYPLPGSLANP